MEKIRLRWIMVIITAQWAEVKAEAKAKEKKSYTQCARGVIAVRQDFILSSAGSSN